MRVREGVSLVGEAGAGWCPWPCLAAQEDISGTYSWAEPADAWPRRDTAGKSYKEKGKEI